jgi:hypothetical protein
MSANSVPGWTVSILSICITFKIVIVLLYFLRELRSQRGSPVVIRFPVVFRLNVTVNFIKPSNSWLSTSVTISYLIILISITYFGFDQFHYWTIIKI